MAKLHRIYEEVVPYKTYKLTVVDELTGRFAYRIVTERELVSSPYRTSDLIEHMFADLQKRL